MAIEIFNRYENKYMISALTFEKIAGRISDYMSIDKYNRNGRPYSVCNIYYDTEDSQMIRTSLQKPKYKEKLRLRSYGKVDENGEVFIEIKKKYDGLTNKRRSAIILKDAEKFILTGMKPEITAAMNEQVINEITYMLTHKMLRPQVYLSYERFAYFSTDNQDVRISFDQNILTRRYDLSLTSEDYGVPLIDEDKRLMEIKVHGSMPLWLAHILSEYRIYPIGFSKYGTEFENYIHSEGPSQAIPFITYSNMPDPAAFSAASNY